MPVLGELALKSGRELLALGETRRQSFQVTGIGEEIDNDAALVSSKAANRDDGRRRGGSLCCFRPTPSALSYRGRDNREHGNKDYSWCNSSVHDDLRSRPYARAMLLQSQRGLFAHA
jgi:hypothetical protein